MVQLPATIDDYRGYIYANINIPEPVTWTVGLNYTDYNEDADQSNDVSRLNPKVGVQWNITPDLQVRAAYIETVKPALAANRTLEPTQVAGFNQLFDEANATKSSRYGFGVDWQVTPDLAIGGEMTWRDIEEPFHDADQDRIVDVDTNEQLHQVYLYWTPFDELAVRAGFAYDKFDRESEDFLARIGIQDPLKVETISVPVSLSYFHPSGFFAAVGATFVDQEVERLSQFENQGHDNFFVVDLGVGYRFPNRHGIASLRFRTCSMRAWSSRTTVIASSRKSRASGPYFPDRTILGRVTLNF